MRIAAGILGFASATSAMFIAMLATLSADAGMSAKEFARHLPGTWPDMEPNTSAIPDTGAMAPSMETIAVVFTTLSAMLLLWSMVAFMGPKRTGSIAFLAFALTTFPIALILFESMELLVSVPACASALCALRAARPKPVPPRSNFDRIEPKFPTRSDPQGHKPVTSNTSDGALRAGVGQEALSSDASRQEENPRNVQGANTVLDNGTGVERTPTPAQPTKTSGTVGQGAQGTQRPTGVGWQSETETEHEEQSR